MPRNRLIVVVLLIVIIVIGGTLLYSRYFLTPSYQQRIVEQQGTPVLASTATP
jgi:hypothetical protein